MGNEQEIYLRMCERWRNLPKPTIAQVQGKCIAGGLMLAWVCDLIIASEDATFQDPVVQFGICGAEYFAHPWELGARKAKEMLFTSDWIGAHDAHRLGMVNQVVPREKLETFTLEVAAKIAVKPAFALKMAKEAVNQALDQQGQTQSIRASFGLHQLCHSHNMQLHGVPVDPSGLPSWLGVRARRVRKRRSRLLELSARRRSEDASRGTLRVPRVHPRARWNAPAQPALARAGARGAS